MLVEETGAAVDVIIPLDVADRGHALALVDRLGDGADFYKVGLELFTSGGPAIVHELRERGKRTFLDLKLHDIPTTVARAVSTAASLGVDLLTLHATGGSPMMEAAVEAAAAFGEARPRLLAVTVLTSSSASDVETSWGRPIQSVREEVMRLAALAREAGVDGIVASALEASAVRRRVGPDFLIVTPGIRLPEDPRHDQHRVATPAEAREAGADYLVIGRPITAADDPPAVLARIRTELEGAP